MCLRQTGGPVPGGNVTEAGLSLSFFYLFPFFLRWAIPLRPALLFRRKLGQ